MDIINRLKQIAFSLGLVGFISTLLLFGMIFSLGITWEITYENNLILPEGYNPLRDLSIRFLFISVLYLIFIAFLRMRDRIFLQATAIIPLAFTIPPCMFLIIFKPEGAPIWIMEYSSWDGVVLSLGYVFLILTVVLVSLQLYLIWSISHSSTYKTHDINFISN